MIKTVFFDLGNVLVFFSDQKMMDQVEALSGLSQHKIEQLLVGQDLRSSYEAGKIDSVHLYQIFQNYAPKSFSFPEFMRAFSDIFTPNTDLWPLVEKVKKLGVRLVLLSNTSECHFNRIYSHFPVLQLFDETILSYEVGACKPDSLIYEKALTLAGCEPEECFYTDDIPEYIAAGRKIGLDGETYKGVAPLVNQLAKRGLELA